MQKSGDSGGHSSWRIAETFLKSNHKTQSKGESCRQVFLKMLVSGCGVTVLCTNPICIPVLELRPWIQGKPNISPSGPVTLYHRMCSVSVNKHTYRPTQMQTHTHTHTPSTITPGSPPQYPGRKQGSVLWGPGAPSASPPGACAQRQEHKPWDAKDN